MRKMVQLQTLRDEYGEDSFLALCDDGTAWYRSQGKGWLKLWEIPQTHDTEVLNAERYSEGDRWNIGLRFYDNFEKELAKAKEKIKAERAKAAEESNQ